MSELRFSAFLQGPLGEAITTEDGPGLLPHPSFVPTLAVQRSGETEPQTVNGPALGLLGPGDVAALAPGTVVRCEPAPGAADVEPNHLACVEVQPPELPWVLTPARPRNENGGRRLRPWLVLVVVEATAATIATGDPLPTLATDASLLPDLRDSWAWAHVQRLGERDRVARLICPRRLEPGRDHLACLVPAFTTTAAGHQPAWDVETGGPVLLPVFHHWGFRTGPEGDFEALVRRLGPADPAQVQASSTRSVDVRQPWTSSPPLAESAQVVGVAGALTPFGDPPQVAEAAAASVLSALDRELRDQLDAPGVGAPLYAGTHVGAQSVTDAPSWVQQLNTTVADRIAAGLGAAYVREHQEELVARAWQQAGAIREVNRQRAVVELTTAVAERVHARHVATLTDGEVVAFSAPAGARARTSDTTTLATELTVSPLSDGVASAAFARRVRPGGKLARRSGVTVNTLLARAMSGEVVVPERAPVVPETTEVGTQAVAPLVATATAEQLVVLAAMADVAALNEVPAPALHGGLAGLDARVRQLSLAGDVRLLARTVAPVLGDLTAVAGAAMTSLSSEASPATDEVSVYGVPLRADAVAGRVRGVMRPGTSHYARLASQTQLPPEMAPSWVGDQVMDCPEFPVPTALTLLESDPEWFVPGLGGLPINRVALMRQNPAFIESYLVGLNHEMMRELLWRLYPTDQRGTPFTRFWPRPDGAPDIDPIHTWSSATALGDQLLGDRTLAVVLVRGDVLRRYPSTIVSAVPAAYDGTYKPRPDGYRAPLFVVRVDEQTNAYAFEIDEDELAAEATPERPGWFFVFAENGFRTRFGFDEHVAGEHAFDSWNDAMWPPPGQDSAAGSGQVPVRRGHAVADQPWAPTSADERSWGRDAADVARIAVQKPFRVFIQSDLLLPRKGAQ